MERLADEPGPDAFEVWPENEDAVRLFLALSTQWRFAGGGVVTGLIYASAEAVMRMRGVKRAKMPVLFDALRVMEGAALDVLNGKK